MMKAFFAPVLFFSLVISSRVWADEPQIASPYKSRPGPAAVTELRADWKDEARHRIIPVKIYYPAIADAPCSIILFSPGLGGSREAAEYLGRHWASYGYIGVFVQHPGSDESLLKDTSRKGRKLLRQAANADNAAARQHDISFVIDRLLQLNPDGKGELPLRLDVANIGVAGHSFGAHASLLTGGMKMMNRRARQNPPAEARVRAAVVLSSPVPREGVDLKTVFGGIGIPMLHMTGTLDNSPLDPGGATPEQRRIPFDNIFGGTQYLTVFEGGDHAVFSGRKKPGRDAKKDALIHGLILQSTMAFWDAYLKNDAAALRWLQNDFAKVLNHAGSWEWKKGK